MVKVLVNHIKKVNKQRKQDAWFWSKEWQDKMKEAQRDFDNGDYEEYLSVEEFIDSFGG